MMLSPDCYHVTMVDDGDIGNVLLSEDERQNLTFDVIRDRDQDWNDTLAKSYRVDFNYFVPCYYLGTVIIHRQL